MHLRRGYFGPKHRLINGAVPQFCKMMGAGRYRAVLQFNVMTNSHGSCLVSCTSLHCRNDSGDLPGDGCRSIFRGYCVFRSGAHILQAALILAGFVGRFSFFFFFLTLLETYAWHKMVSYVAYRKFKEILCH